jgi:epoxide hydrolase-like predicted phosphatase
MSSCGDAGRVTPPPPDHPRRALLVDYGGVLTTNVYEAFEDFAAREGLAPGAVAAVLSSGPAARSLLTGIEEGRLSDAEFERGFGELLGVAPEGLIGRLLGGMRADRAMIDMVRAVRRAGVPTGLVSNSWGVDFYPEDLLAELFDVVVISGRVGMRKPSPEIYRHAAGELGLEPGECVFVDDLTRNLGAAADLGMATLHHTDSGTTIPEVARLLGISIDEADPARRGASDPTHPAAQERQDAAPTGEDVPREGMAGLSER